MQDDAIVGDCRRNLTWSRGSGLHCEQQRNDESAFKRLEDKIAALEAEVAQLRLAGSAVTPQQVDAALRDLGQKTKDGKIQSSYFNVRFRSIEVALANIRALGNELGQRLYKEKQRSHKAAAPGRVKMKSKPCTQADIESDWGVFWTNEVRWPRVYHRKLWELVYVPQTLWSAGKLASGSRGLGFGCGKECLPALFAKYGATILATDLAADRPEAKAWSATNQHTSSVAALRKINICSDEKLLQNIDFRPVDMNNIDRDLDSSFDFCWSICALEHLGSIKKGFNFIENSLRTLRPGGVAVHTMEFTFDTGPERDNHPSVLFTQAKISEFTEKLRRQGFTVADLDFSPGNGLLDGYADIPMQFAHVGQRLDLLHLKICLDGYVCTSFGLIVTAPEIAAALATGG